MLQWQTAHSLLHCCATADPTPLPVSPGLCAQTTAAHRAIKGQVDAGKAMVALLQAAVQQKAWRHDAALAVEMATSPPGADLLARGVQVDAIGLCKVRRCIAAGVTLDAWVVQSRCLACAAWV
jgi:hypothetical protein